MISRRKERLLRGLRRRKGRSREGLFVAEGIRAVEAALDAGAAAEFAAVAPRLRDGERGRALEAALEDRGIPVEELADSELDGLADTESPQGVLLVCPVPEIELDALRPGEEEARILVADGVQDPGNLGTLVRSATAFGAAGVVALDGTVDPWNPKAVRASAGALFRIPVTRSPWRAFREWLGGVDLALVAADASGEDVTAVAPPRRIALAVGNEGAGVRPELLERADRVVAVPMRGRLDSLNVAMAGSILFFLLSRPGPVGAEAA